MSSAARRLWGSSISTFRSAMSTSLLPFGILPLPYPRARQPQQLLDVVVAPLEAGAEEEGAALLDEGIVVASDQVEVGGELVAAEEAELGVLVVRPVEVEGLEGEEQPVVEDRQRIFDLGAAAPFDDA